MSAQSNTRLLDRAALSGSLRVLWLVSDAPRPLRFAHARLTPRHHRGLGAVVPVRVQVSTRMVWAGAGVGGEPERLRGRRAVLAGDVRDGLT